MRELGMPVLAAAGTLGVLQAVPGGGWEDLLFAVLSAVLVAAANWFTNRNRRD